MHMATWKEKGVVPDSDDDEDLLDSQSNPSSNERHDGNPTTNRRNPDYLGAVKSTQNDARQIDLEWLQTENDLVYNEHNAVRTSEAAASKPNLDGGINSSHSSPQRLFRDPRTLFNLDDTAGSQNPPQIPISHHSVDVEEISRSYVRLTSPTSSPLSSPPNSPHDHLQPKFSQNPGSNSSVQRTQEPSTAAGNPVPGFERPADYAGRIFRQRNPIQLHPYIVEQEKYRRSLKARGMTPMRLAQAPDEYSKRTQDVSSPESESQEFQPEESQAIGISWNSVPSSSGQSTLRENTGHGPGEGNDEFPDIDELFQGEQSHTHQFMSRRGQKRYSSKSQRQQMARVHRQLTQDPHHTGRAESIFDVPASPPQTSSPLPLTSRGVRRSMSRTVSNTSSALEEDDLHLQKSRDLLTPATSVIKPAPHSALVELDSDGEDPFATEPSVYSSSDESVQIRRISKKLRGVLPASHLKLDQHFKKPGVPSVTRREYLHVSPARESPRRGVALPRAVRGSRSSSPSTNLAMPFLAGDSGESENDTYQSGFVMEDNDSALSDLFSQQRMGSAEEDDRVDTMLPPHKRQGRHLGAQASKRRRIRPSSILPKGHRTNTRQIKITQHLTTSPKSNPSKRAKHRQFGETSGRSFGPTSRRQKSLAPPRLGILDVISADGQDQRSIPQFIKVAARAARSKHNQGRQSPSRKFIRLASREDTVDAQSVLQSWKDGNIKPRDPRRPLSKDFEVLPVPLNPISDNRQKVFRPMAKQMHGSQTLDIGDDYIRRPRKIVILRGRQRSMRDFVISDPAVHRPSRQSPHESRPKVIQQLQERQNILAPQSRPAQLELSEVEYSHRNPANAFGSRKKALDNLYKTTRKRHIPHTNIPLSRFLSDKDAGESTINNESYPDIGGNSANDMLAAKRIPRCRKRPPQRMDVGAAAYRQPSEPLVLEFLPPRQIKDASDEINRLQGLGKFGTRYTIHFDIFPLQSGIFFHEATFIGSGRLLAVLKQPGPVPSNISRPSISYLLGERTFIWGPWNDDVSSDVGVCFDWVIEQLNIPCTASTTPSVRDDIIGIATLVVDYVQHHLSFTDLSHLGVFLSRMIDVISEALDRLDPKSIITENFQCESRIEVVSMWAVLVMQLLQISRNQVKRSSTIAKLEDLLVKTASHCIELLFYKGLESIRKLYDDLQYLSFRENGIKRDQRAAHCWVVIIKILGAAKIPQGSFWDVTNSRLLEIHAAAMNDARSMEKIWYSIFSLLPLCEFDNSGVVIPGIRQKVCFDNWPLPQKMLKSVFVLYSSSSRQSPSFNDYCRALVSRCHYLMVEWGWWKCNGIIGVIFDFFASQNLGHLRNEEVYKSPRFLDELDTEPSLAVEPDDRCFHIFLKIVALAIAHMRAACEGKNIRNLAFRLLPNHDRQYPKEEALDTRDLASLRNHHDLLCTLYWAAPPEQQPSLNLIQGLVVADQSHNAACLINLRAWQQLACFVLTWCTTSEAFQPFLLWQNAFFFKLFNQFLSEDSDTRRDAALLGGELISETRLRETITRNQTSTMALLRSAINALRCAMLSATSTHAAMAAFNTRILNSVFSTEGFHSGDLTESLLADTIGVLGSYMDLVERLHPQAVVPSQPTALSAGEDSQGSLGVNMNVDRQMMIFSLYQEIRPHLCELVRQILEHRIYHSREPQFMKTLIERWAQMVSLVTEESSGLKEFLPGGESAVFIRRRGCERANKYWPLFLGELLRYKSIEDLKAAGFDIGLEWMLILVTPLSEPAHLSRLTLSMSVQKHPLVKLGHDMEVALHSPSFASSWLIRHLIQGAIDYMRETTKDSSWFLDGQPKPSNKLPQRDFSFVLKEVLVSMQHDLESMVAGSTLHEQYMRFCQGVVEDIRSRGSEILPLTDFFVTPSASYWPEEGDPRLFAAGIISYSLRLREQPGRTSSELFHYLYRGWRSDLIHRRLKNHISYITKGLKHWSFTEFALTNFVPAALQLGFGSEFGWILCSTYLPPLADRISKLLERNDSEARATLNHLTTIFKLIMNGCIQQRSRWQTTIKGIHPLHRGIVAVGCQFWLSLVPAINGYADRHPQDSVLIGDVKTALVTFAQETVRAFDGTYEGGCETHPFHVIEAPYMKDAVVVMMNDVDKNWTLNITSDAAMQSASGKLSIGGFGARGLERTSVNLEQLWVCTLRDVLETARPHFEIGHPCSIPKIQRTSSTRSSRYFTDLFF